MRRGRSQSSEVSPQQVAVLPVTASTAVVLGPVNAVDVLGESIRDFPSSLTQAAVGANAALQGFVSAQQATGRLVRLTDESLALLKQYGAATDAAGVMTGVVRESNGSIVGFLKFSATDSLAAASGVGSALATIAMQMQLQAILDGIRRVELAVDSLMQHELDKRWATVESARKLLERHFQLALKSGFVTDEAWAEVAAIRETIGSNLELAGVKIDRGVDRLTAIGPNPERLPILAPSATDRRKALASRDIDMRLDQWVPMYRSAWRSAVLADLLHAQRLLVSGSPSLSNFVDQAKHRWGHEEHLLRERAERLNTAMVHATSGDLSSWNPIRNFRNDKDAFLLRMRDLQELVRPLREDAANLTIARARGELSVVPIPAGEGNSPERREA